MGLKSINRPQGTWTDTLVVMQATDTRIAQFTRSTSTNQSAPTAKLLAEEEADRWVEQQLFDHYNG